MILDRTIKTILLLAILVGFPLGSYLYLTRGLEFRKEAMAELKKYGQIRPLNCTDAFGETRDTSWLRGRVVLMTTFDWEGAPEKERAVLEHVLDQFSDRTDFVALMLSSGNVRGTDGQERICTADQPSSVRLTDQLAAIAATRVDLAHMAFLADPDKEIRLQFDLRDSQQVDRMVEHIAWLLPD